KVDIHLIKGAILSGFILSFIEIMKELPLTLILRPFNLDTLSTKAFQYASDEQIHEAALASIIIIVISAIAIYLFHHVKKKEPKRSEEHTSELQSRFDLVCRLLLATK